MLRWFFSIRTPSQGRIRRLEASNGLCLWRQIQPDGFLSSYILTAEITSA